jgi:hypothetical protein
MSKIHGTNVHILPDENLGGVLREYVEVDRKANVGDYVYFNDDIDTPEYLKVTGYNHDIDYYKVEHDPNEWGATVEVSYEACRTLEPTDIIRVNDERYRLVDRKAKVGEKVLIVNARPLLPYSHIGEVVEIIGTDGDTYGGMLKPYDIGEKGAVYRFQYRVLESVEPAEEGDDVLTVDETEASKSVLDLLANLALRVTELERKLDRNNSSQPIKTLDLSDLNGKLLRIYNGVDIADGIKVTVTVGIDEETGVMYVINHKSEVVADE